MIPTVRSFASGRSTAANFTPLSRSVSRKAALRDSRSSLAITSVAPVTLARCSALPSSGRSGLRPLSTSVKRAISVRLPLCDEAVDRLPLRLDPEPARALPRGADPLVADDPHPAPPTRTA